MLRRLSIRNLRLVEHLDVAFAPGLNVLTGETGAGKSILLDALGLALGARAAASDVRAGAEEAVVVAAFDVAPGHPARAALREIGADANGEEELILRRVLSASGRSRAFIDDAPSPAATLRALGRRLVELHGQHDDLAAIGASGHRALLDAFGGHAAMLSETAARCAALEAAEAAAAEAAAREAQAAEERAETAEALEELDEWSAEPGEEATLAEERRRLKAAEQVAEDVRGAVDALGGDGVEARLSDAARRLARAAQHAGAELSAAQDALERAISETAEAAALLSEAAHRLTADPRRLEAVEARLFGLRGLARRRRVSVEELPVLRERLAARLASLDGAQGASAAARATAAAARSAYDAAAARLTEARRAAAAALETGVAEELPLLKLGHARFAVQLAPIEAPGPAGAETVRFEIATAPGAPFGPLAEVASGGELSRLLLALKVRLAKRPELSAAPPTLVFDEIDRGMGGAEAEAIGARLRRLAEAGGGDAPAGQALAVTHSPQVAARAHRHHRISKTLMGPPRAAASEPEDAEGLGARIGAAALDGAGRVEEIARMLSGETVTEAARNAARDLLAGSVDMAAPEP